MIYPTTRPAPTPPPSARPSAIVPLTARIRAASRRMSAGFVAVLLAALITFAWQSFVTQTHIHPDPAPIAAHVGSAQLSGTQPAPDRPIDCPICHDSALAGHYLSPGPALILAVFAGTIWRFAAAARPASRPARSHAWQSRAPPAARA